MSRATSIALQALRADEREKVAAKLRAIADSTDLPEFIARRGLSSPSLIGDVLRAAAAEVESWPMVIDDED